MGLESDPCQLRTSAGELVARGFVREHHDDVLVIDAQTRAGAWFAVSDAAVAEVFDPDRGTLVYHGLVDGIANTQIRLRRIRLQVSKQQRAALRVPTDLPVRLVARLGGPDGEEPIDPPLVVTAIDLSAHGLRMVTDGLADRGDRWRAELDTPTRTMALTIEVVRVEDVRGGRSCGCRFLDASDRDHDELFAWVMALQRQLLARRSEREGIN